MGRRVLEYDVALEVDFPSNTFRGVVEISGLDTEGKNELDSVNLAIDDVRAKNAPTPIEVEQRANRLVIGPAGPGEATIRIAFSGRAAERAQTGFFVSRLGPDKALTTQMEPESCRRLFPCIDRPDRKAVFRLRVATQPGLVVISNMPSESRLRSDGRREWTFAATPPMSPYLLYLGVGPFEEWVDDDGPIRVVVAGPKGHRGPAQRTARLAREILRGFTEYFDVPYPLPKLHLVALSDFWAGMENWGAISGCDDQYLLDEDASPVNLEFGEEVIAHEIAHQWFGDLVTLRTWDDLWLNESFATFAVPIAQERAYLRRDPWAEFRMRTFKGDYMDSLRSGHPVKPESYDPAEIMANADEITYQKGARLIRMIEAYLGRDGFRDGITEYLRDHRFGNARSDDLWETLEEESGKPVSQVMRTWVERAGHPCVRVRQLGPDVELTQHRFTFVPGNRSEPPWPIPLTWEQGDARGSLVFGSERLMLPGRDGTSLLLDPGRTGFFRILWDPELRPRRTAQLPSLAPEDRQAYVHDACAFLISGDHSLEDYLAVLRVVTSATDRLTVEEVARSLDLLHPVLHDVRAFGEGARDFCRAQIRRLVERSALGEPEAWDVVRDWVFWIGVRVDDDFARALAQRFERIDRERPPLRQAIAAAYARAGGPKALDGLMARARGPDPDAGLQACRALEGISEPTSVLRVLDEALSSIRLASVYAYLIPSIAKNPAARAPLWTWLARNLRELERRAAGSPMLALLAERAIPLVGIGRSEELRQYFERENFPEGLPGIRRGLELLEAHERLRDRLRAGRDP